MSLELRPGEIHALLGVNGSGKSTLIRIMAGVDHADAGELESADVRLDLRSHGPDPAKRIGLRFVHQERSTFTTMTVLENLAAEIGFERGFGGRIDWAASRARVQTILDGLHIEATADQKLGTLRPVTQTMVTIARVLQEGDAGACVALVLDEPTASLPPAEVELLHEALRRYAAEGQSVLYVTHRLDELRGFIDRATVLRDGQTVGRFSGDEIDLDQLAQLIAGDVLDTHHRTVRSIPSGPPRLTVSGLTGGPVSDVDLSAHAGEIVGLAGLARSGRSSILQMIFGLLTPARGEVRLDGEELPAGHCSPDARIAYVPEDRAQDAAFRDLTLGQNLTAAETGRFWRHLRLNHRLERRENDATIDRFGIKAPHEGVPFRTLSGGNQQKAIVARWLRRRPSVLLVDEPTQGVDVGARAEIHGLLREAAAQGACALVVSSDFEELAALCDRVLVVVRGRVEAELSASDLTPARLERAAYGVVAA